MFERTNVELRCLGAMPGLARSGSEQMDGGSLRAGGRTGCRRSAWKPSFARPPSRPPPRLGLGSFISKRRARYPRVELNSEHEKQAGGALRSLTKFRVGTEGPKETKCISVMYDVYSWFPCGLLVLNLDLVKRRSGGRRELVKHRRRRHAVNAL